MKKSVHLTKNRLITLIFKHRSETEHSHPFISCGTFAPSRVLNANTNLTPNPFISCGDGSQHSIVNMLEVFGRSKIRMYTIQFFRFLIQIHKQNPENTVNASTNPPIDSAIVCAFTIGLFTTMISGMTISGHHLLSSLIR